MKWPPWQSSDCPDSEARRADENAKKNLREIREEWPRVHRVTEGLRRMKKENSFGDAIERIMRGDEK